jgi:hypothetical protein
MEKLPSFQRPEQTAPYDVVMRIVEEKTLPPKKVSSIRDSEQGIQLRYAAYAALAKLEVGQRLEIHGDDVTRELLNSYINGYALHILKTLTELEYKAVKRKKFFVSKIERTLYGIWRIR